MSQKLVIWPVGSGLLLFLSLATVASGGVLITGAEEVGDVNDPVGPYVTGQTFYHESLADDFTVPTLDEDVLFFVDRLHEYNGATATDTIESLGLVGAEYVMVSNDNKGVLEYELEIQVAQTADAFYFMDDRNDEVPDWLTQQGWVYTGYQMGIDEAGDGIGPGDEIDQQFSIWKKSDIPPGTLTTYESLSGGHNMYGIAFTPPGQGPGIKDFPDPWPGADFKPGSFGLIDIGATGGRAEDNALQDTDAITQIGGGAHNENGIDLDVRDMTSDLGGEFSITIDNLDEDELDWGGLDWRDRGNYRAADAFDLPLIKLGEDLVKNNLGIIRVTLSDLPAGPFTVTSYHVDPDFDQCEEILIYVDNGNGDGYVDTGVIGQADWDVGGVEGLTPEFMQDIGATFSFEADGVNDVMILFDGRFAADDEVPLAGLNIQFGSATAPGDYNENGELDAGDLDLQAQAMAGGMHPKEYDLNDDDLVNFADREVWVNDLKNTWIGDANMDLQFNSGDMVQVFVRGKYETGEEAGWEDGDWNGDTKFGSSDMVAAFAAGGYEKGEKAAAVSAVPEPGSLGLLFVGLIGLAAWVRRSR